MEKLWVEDMQKSKWHEALVKVHSANLLTKVEKASEELEAGQTSYTLAEDNYENMYTFRAAKIASETCLTAVEAVLGMDCEQGEESKYDTGYCIVRPPGHHAHSEDI